ncbi:RloB domain-containing protein [Pseudoalteromonas phenolica]|uniref:RloB domain-containing protein n=1 Tax=Pseudoalteromonas phenolica TaxID=161398 RepID=UPI00110A3215|nr:RloB domain-containing protein [Pseudoalteromonas phenolica]TMO53096.1 hypothetical protein CWC21_21210 [Pseudoalteromonas phenolica]
MARKKRPIKETLVIVAEGQADEAFVKHVKSLFGVGNPRVTPKSAGGKGPSNVIGDAIGTLRSSGCDRVASILDTDLPWPATKVREAKSKKIRLIGSNPCLEGLLLKILGKRVPASSNDCKEELHPMLSGKETEKESYAELFTKELLNEARKTVPELDELIKLISGELK